MLSHPRIADPPDGHSQGRAVPLRIFAHVPLPAELAEAIGAVLDADAREKSASARSELRLRTRCALDAWLDGGMTTSQTVSALLLAPRVEAPKRRDGKGGYAVGCASRLASRQFAALGRCAGARLSSMTGLASPSNQMPW